MDRGAWRAAAHGVVAWTRLSGSHVHSFHLTRGHEKDQKDQGFPQPPCLPAAHSLSFPWPPAKWGRGAVSWVGQECLAQLTLQIRGQEGSWVPALAQSPLGPL